MKAEELGLTSGKTKKLVEEKIYSKIIKFVLDKTVGDQKWKGDK